MPRAGWWVGETAVGSPRKRFAWRLCLSSAAFPSSSRLTLGCRVPKSCLESGMDIRCSVLPRRSTSAMEGCSRQENRPDMERPGSVTPGA